MSVWKSERRKERECKRKILVKNGVKRKIVSWKVNKVKN